MKQDESVNKLRGERLTTARELKGLKQEGLAKRVGYSAAYISMLEKGKRDFTLDMVHSFAKALDIQPEYLTGETDKMIKHPLDDLINAITSPLTRTHDLFFLRYLSTLQISIVFHCIRQEKLYNDDKLDNLKEENEYKVSVDLQKNIITEYNSDQGIIKCPVKDTNETIELRIYAVSINDQHISYGQFYLLANQAEMNLELTLSKATYFSRTFDLCVDIDQNTKDDFDMLIDLQIPTEKAQNPAEKALFS